MILKIKWVIFIEGKAILSKSEEKKTSRTPLTEPAPGINLFADRDDYLSRTAMPLQSLVFLFPLLIVYELGTLLYAADISEGAIQTIKARRMILEYCEMALGQLGYYLPGLLVIAVPLGLHFYLKHRWRIYPWGLLGMLFESVVLTLPLLVFGILVMGSASGGGQGELWKAELVYSIGAGLYEELLFRVLGVGIPVLIMMRWLQIDRYTAAAVMIVITSVLFAVYHFNARNPYELRKMVYYTVAGVYFGVLYVTRGFGIVAGAHAFYDVLVVAIRYDMISFE